MSITTNEKTRTLIGPLAERPATGKENGEHYVSESSVTAWNESVGNWVGGGAPAAAVALLNNVYVAKSGNDSTGDGSLSKPFLTIAAALASITTASRNNRFCVMIAAGRYDEILPINLKADVFLRGGEQWMATRVSAPSWGLDPAFPSANDPRTGISNIVIGSSPFGPGNCNWDFNAVSSNEGKLYIDSCWLQTDVTITAYSTISQYVIDDCLAFGNFVVNGGNFHPRTTFFQGPVSFLSSPSPINPNSQFVDDHSTFLAPVILNKTGPETWKVQLYGSSFDSVTASLTATGVMTVQATGDAIPPKSRVSLAGGATLLRMTDGFGTGFQASIPANWAIATPDNLNDAVNRIAIALSGLLGGPIP